MSKYQVIRGFPFPNSQRFKRENVEAALDYVPRDGDIIIASYPKTGTTWLQYIIYQIISRGEFFPSAEESYKKYSPYLEVVGTSSLEQTEKLRSYKHHCPYNMVQKNDKAKCLYIYRKPEDTCVSFYHFLQQSLGKTFPFDEFFEEFLSGELPFGLYFDHVLSFFTHRKDDNLLLVSYEELQRNRKGEILKISKFLGEEYFQSLNENDSLMEKIMKHTSFDYMKKNLTFMFPDASPTTTESKVNFFRKGVVGDGKNYLSPDQMKRLKDRMIERLSGSSLLDEWLEE